MNIRDYLVGVPVTLRSPLSPEEIGRRIKDEIQTSLWLLPLRSGPVGRLRDGWLRLKYVSSIFEYNAKPILSGIARRTETGTILELDYRSTFSMRLFLVVWFLFLVLFAVILLVVDFDPPLRGAERIFPFLVLAAMFVIPILTHLFGTRNSDTEQEELLDFLERVAEARR